MKRLCMCLVIVALMITACEIRNPVLPEWDVTLTVPLIHQQYFVSDLVDSVNITTGEGDVLVLRGTGTAETPAFGEVGLTPGISFSDAPLVVSSQEPLRAPFADSEGLVMLSYGLFNSGEIRAKFQSVSPLVDELSITIAELKTPSGQPFQIAYSGSSGWQSHSLVDCRIGTLNSGEILDSLTITVNVSPTLPQNTQVATLDLSMNTPVSFSLFQGRMVPHDLPLQNNATTINIDYPYDIEEAIQLQTASMSISLENQLGFDCIFHGNLVAENTRTGETRSVPILDDFGNPFQVTALQNTAGGPTVEQLIFSEGVDELLQIMPDRISINDAYFTIMSSMTGAIGTVRDTDAILAAYQVDAPFTFELFASTIRLQDPVRIDISEENRTRILNNALGADLQLLVKNQVPIGVTADLYFGSTDSIDPDSTSSYLLHRSVTLHSKQWVADNPNAPDINANGEQLIELSLSEAEVDIFANPNVFLLWTFSFEPSGGVITVTASPADYIRIKSMIRVGMHFSEDL